MRFLVKNDKKEKANNPKKNNKKQVKNVDREVVQELLDIKSIDGCYIKKSDNRNFCFVKVKPINVNIMPDKVIFTLIEKFSIMVDMIKDFSIMVGDKVETLDDNKEYMYELLKNEENPSIRELIERDIEMLNDFEEGEGIAREFFIIMSFKSGDFELFKGDLRDRLKMFREQGFVVEEATEREIKSMLQVYLERNFSNEVIKDYDL